MICAESFTGATDILLLKPGAEVRIDGDVVSKRMCSNELDAYLVLQEYAGDLSTSEPSIVVPDLLEYDHDEKVGKLTNIGSFRQFSPVETFGEADVYSHDYYTAFLSLANVIRHVIPTKAVKDRGDYEASNRGQIPTISYLENYHRGNEPTHVTALFPRVIRSVLATQISIEDLPLYASHRDPNPNNYFMWFDGSKCREAKIIDWETFGLARRGYEEGRLFSYLALDPEKQVAFLDLAANSLSHEAEMAYFWRTAITRAYRDALSFSQGFYDSRMLQVMREPSEVDRRRNEVTAALCDIVRRGLKELVEQGYEI